MTKPILYVYDDEQRVVDRIIQRLSGPTMAKRSFEVKPLSNPQLNQELDLLETRQKQAREGKKWVNNSILDGAAALLVDYDLLQAGVQGPSLVGETVAYYARCFSRCGLIVGLNQFGPRTFDLSLKGHIESFADINIGSEHVANRNLWGKSKPGFHPWCWPSLPDFHRSHELRMKDALDHLDQPILKTLGFGEDIELLLPRSAVEFLGETPLKITFRQFACESGNGFRRKDVPADDESAARVAAARISKWLERCILPGQDILVDAPHLVPRFPSLLLGKLGSVSSWNRLANKTSVAGIRASAIQEAQLEKQFWLSRPAWFWPLVAKSEKIAEVKAPWEMKPPKWVFCEDTSRFSDKDKCSEFVAETESAYARRFVEKLSSEAEYRPAVRFSM